MKKLRLLIVIVFLAGCSQVMDRQLTLTETSIAPTATTVDPTEDLIVRGIKISFSKSPHAGVLICEQCHSSSGGIITGGLIWKDENTSQEEIISTSTEVCVKCHVEQISHDQIDTSITLAYKDFTCTDCHEPHNLQANCSTCHSDIEEIINAQIAKPGNHNPNGDITSYMCGGSSCHELNKEMTDTSVYHQPIHSTVPCVVCHDVSGLPVTRAVDQTWVTTGNITQTNASKIDAVVSHVIGNEVNCLKCHFSDNPWDLTDLTPSN